MQLCELLGGMTLGELDARMGAGELALWIAKAQVDGFVNDAMQRRKVDRAGALERCGLDLSDSECAILLAIPGEHLQAMIAQLAPSSPARRSLFRRLAAAAGIALFGVAAATSQMGCRRRPQDGPEGARPDLPRRSKPFSLTITNGLDADTEGLERGRPSGD